MEDLGKNIVAEYNDEKIKSLDWQEHIRRRPGMYIGKLGDGKYRDDGIYILIKEVIDNSIDEFAMGNGKVIEIKLDNKTISVRDYGRGIPQGKLVDAVGRPNTGAKYDSAVFKRSVGLNGVGTKAVNALSAQFKAVSYRDGFAKTVTFEKGILKYESKLEETQEKNGTLIVFTPDDAESLFGDFHYNTEYIEDMLKIYSYLNSGLIIKFNGNSFVSKNGLFDLLSDKLNEEPLYPIIHLQSEDFEIAITHGSQYNEEYYSFVNGQNTIQGGTHLSIFKEAYVKTIKEFYKKDFDPSDIRQSIVAAISIKIQEPMFESQTKIKLGSKLMEEITYTKEDNDNFVLINNNENDKISFKDFKNKLDEYVPKNLQDDVFLQKIDEGKKFLKTIPGRTIRTFIFNFMNKVDDYLHRNPKTAEILLDKIEETQNEHKKISEVQKAVKERSKRISKNIKKLRDCKVHFNSNHERRFETTIFITEGDSASGSITKTRDVATQAVFSLRGKPENIYKTSKNDFLINTENEELNNLIAALNLGVGVSETVENQSNNIEDEDSGESLDGLRYNNIVIATDADTDGMHIRLLMITFFLKFCPDVIKNGHLYVLQTPLFRVRNKQETIYCYDEKEKENALKKLKNTEITRFKGLGEISPSEFAYFIGKNIRLEPITLTKQDKIKEMLDFYMGDNTQKRQNFTLENLRVDVD